MQYPKSIQNLINMFSQLPSVGRKTAERYVFSLLKKDAENLQKFAQAIAELKENITLCKNCLAVTESDPCEICADKKRDHSVICVVSNTRDLISLESTRQYNGLYHVLGGAINTIDGIGPEQLNIKQLIYKLKNSKIKEILMALNPNLEGETTVMYLTKLIRPFKIKITRLAKGLPMGADLEYADEITLSNSIKYRNIL